MAKLDIVEDIFATAFEQRRAKDNTHTEPGPDGRHCWHASTISGCTRALILKRAGHATDGHRLSSLATFEIGHTYHRLLEEGGPKLQRDSYTFLAAEHYMRHKTVSLAGTLDLLFAWKGTPFMLDLKTESTYSGSNRRKDAKTAERKHSARPEHVRQVAAYSLLLADTTGQWVHDGVVCYIDKESGDRDYQRFEITDADRQWVLDRVAELDAAWATWEEWERLPDRLAPENGKPHWNCRPREVDRNTGEIIDGRGLYCEARHSCMEKFR